MRGRASCLCKPEAVKGSTVKLIVSGAHQVAQQRCDVAHKATPICPIGHNHSLLRVLSGVTVGGQFGVPLIHVLSPCFHMAI